MVVLTRTSRYSPADQRQAPRSTCRDRQTSRPPLAKAHVEHRGRQTQSPRKCGHRQTPHDGRESDQGADCYAGHTPRTALRGRPASSATWPYVATIPSGSARPPRTPVQKKPSDAIARSLPPESINHHKGACPLCGGLLAGRLVGGLEEGYGDGARGLRGCRWWRRWCERATRPRCGQPTVPRCPRHTS